MSDQKIQMQAIREIEKIIGKSLPLFSMEEIIGTFDYKIGYAINEKGNVIGLNLNGCNLKRIFQEIQSLTNLETLFLHSNQIQKIPSDIISSHDARKILEYAKSIEREGGEYLN